jgi:uroporphyrinogen-III synthase
MRVIVTRPQSEARHWVESLRARGFDALAFPLIDIGAAPDESALVDAWRRLSSFHAVMFVSVNAVRQFFACKPQAAEWPAATRAWAPGLGTRAALLDVGLAPSLVDSPAPGSAQFDSESLWSQVAGQAGAGERVLILRGADAAGVGSGRDWLGDQLAGAHVAVETVSAYVRRPPRPEPGQVEQIAQWVADRDVWLFSSSQAIAHLQALAPRQDWACARAIASHPRIAQAARQAGFGVVCESRPGLGAVIAALESFG